MLLQLLEILEADTSDYIGPDAADIWFNSYPDEITEYLCTQEEVRILCLPLSAKEQAVLDAEIKKLFPLD